ncbi:hypothetical protein FGB62_29g230 [Gracilaria domingensis]|nr:hypothetical protein FGB62_29g230 [Gracilaria domingensis]
MRSVRREYDSGSSASLDQFSMPESFAFWGPLMYSTVDPRHLGAALLAGGYVAGEYLALGRASGCSATYQKWRFDRSDEVGQDFLGKEV